MAYQGRRWRSYQGEDRRKCLGALRGDRLFEQAGGYFDGARPLELLAFGIDATRRQLGDDRLTDAPISPDGGVLAGYYGPFDEPAELACRLSATPGVISHGLFQPAMVSDIVVGKGTQVNWRRIDK